MKKNPQRQKETSEVLDTSITLVVVMVSWVYTYVETRQIIYIKYVQFIVCWLYFNKAIFLICF